MNQETKLDKESNKKSLTGPWVLRRALWEKTLFLMDVEADDVHGLLEPLSNFVQENETYTEKEKSEILKGLTQGIQNGPSVVESGVMLIHEQISELTTPIQILVTFKNHLSKDLGDGTSTRFVWILLSQTKTHPFISSVAEFFTLMTYGWFRQRALVANTKEGIINLYVDGLDRTLNFKLGSTELKAPKGPFTGIVSDLKSRVPFWFDDFKCGFNVKVLASILFMFFACAAPAVAFGALVDTLTNGQLGVIETILGTAICGVLWSFLGGQPLVILGATGPNIIFIGILYQLCDYLKIDFFGTFLCVGLWTMLFLFLIAIFNLCTLIRFFTRFTDEIFVSLISLIFINEAVKDLLRLFNDPTVPVESSLLSLLLAFGTFAIAYSLSRFRRTPYLREFFREFLSDFGPTIALGIMTVVAFNFSTIKIDTLNVPANFQTTSMRPWILSPFSVPYWVWLFSAIPAVLLTILIWINHNITSRLVSNPEHHLEKKSAFHWNILVVGALVGVSSLFGLPWVIGTTVPSINHVRSLVVTQNHKIIRTIETRLSNLGVHLLIGLALFLLPLLQYMPMAVLFGIFLFMGVGSLVGNQFIERLRLWFVDPSLFEPVHHLRAVPLKTIHIFTGVQLACLTTLWLVKESPISILFPLFVALLVPVRMFIARFIEAEYVALLDLEEAPDKFSDFGL